MKRTSLAIALPLSMASISSALSHAGSHEHFGIGDVVAHWMTSPFHVAGFLLIALALVSGATLLRRRGAFSRSKKTGS